MIDLKHLLNFLYFGAKIDRQKRRNIKHLFHCSNCINVLLSFEVVEEKFDLACRFTENLGMFEDQCPNQLLLKTILIGQKL